MTLCLVRGNTCGQLTVTVLVGRTLRKRGLMFYTDTQSKVLNYFTGITAIIIIRWLIRLLAVAWATWQSPLQSVSKRAEFNLRERARFNRNNVGLATPNPDGAGSLIFHRKFENSNIQEIFVCTNSAQVAVRHSGQILPGTYWHITVCLWRTLGPGKPCIYIESQDWNRPWDVFGR